MVPLRIARAKTAKNPLLELYFYKDQYQLATHDAIYSDGTRYRPMNMAFNHLDASLKRMSKVLVLGAGLGSAAHILHRKRYNPEYTFVEHDETILKWAIDILPADVVDKIKPVCSHAEPYIRECYEQYDMIVTDIFNSRSVPQFVTTESFLTQCRRCIRPGGHFVMNYIIEDIEAWHSAEENLLKIFPGYDVLINGVNRVIVATI